MCVDSVILVTLYWLNIGWRLILIRSGFKLVHSNIVYITVTKSSLLLQSNFDFKFLFVFEKKRRKKKSKLYRKGHKLQVSGLNL